MCRSMDYADEFELDFLNRTAAIVRQYPRPYDPTMLLNCSIGILVLALERKFGRIPTCPVGEWGIDPSWIIDFGPSNTDAPNSVRNVVRQLRNCVCHCCFATYHQDGRCAGLHFKSDMKGNSFEARIPLEALKYFVLNLAETLIQTACEKAPLTHWRSNGDMLG
jgi:hypothetical protein